METSARSTGPVNASAPMAAVDMGSNSFRLEIGQLPQSRYHGYSRAFRRARRTHALL